MTYRILHFLVVAFYLAAPVVALVGDAVYSIRKRRGVPSSGFVMTLASAVILGTALALVYAVGIGGHVGLGQIFLCIYFAAGLLLLLKGFDWLVTRGATLALRRPLRDPRVLRRRAAMVGVGLARVALLFGVGLPYIMAAVMTYRPKVVPRDDPQSQLGFGFERVSFEAPDGMRIAGWWIPAREPAPRRAKTPGLSPERSPDFGTKTVIVCHGLAANKSNQLVLARELVRGGYNVLIFDFRGHGESGGQLTSLGDLERQDVLGAVRFLRRHRAEESQRIFGLGASLGAAALIAAAADPSDEGQAIEAVAVYGTFDDLHLLAGDIGHARFWPPFDEILPAFGLRIAGAQVGTNLLDFKPAEVVTRLWPRPILIIHGQRDSVIPFDRGERLYRLASHPKHNFWLPDGDHNKIINDDTAATIVKAFFDSARPRQVL
jgi:alpha-beta hydrolase superfamily lysophospholipase